MKGSFICPHCKTENACCCETCKNYIQEGEPVAKWTEDGNAIICDKCGKTYSFDQALDEEFKQRKEILAEIMKLDQKSGLYD